MPACSSLALFILSLPSAPSMLRSFLDPPGKRHSISPSPSPSRSRASLLSSLLISSFFTSGIYRCTRRGVSLLHSWFSTAFMNSDTGAMHCEAARHILYRDIAIKALLSWI